MLAWLSFVVGAIPLAARLGRWLAARLSRRGLTIQEVAEFNYNLGRRWALAAHNPGKESVTDAVVMLDDIWFECMDSGRTLDRWEKAVPMSWRGAGDPARTSIASDAVMYVDLLLQDWRGGARVLEIGYADPSVRSRERLGIDEPFLMQLSVAGAGQVTQFAVVRVDPPVARDPVLQAYEPDRKPVELLRTSNRRADRRAFTK